MKNAKQTNEQTKTYQKKKPNKQNILPYIPDTATNVADKSLVVVNSCQL
jgi:hypothetical protein